MRPRYQLWWRYPWNPSENSSQPNNSSEYDKLFCIKFKMFLMKNSKFSSCWQRMSKKGRFISLTILYNFLILCKFQGKFLFCYLFFVSEMISKAKSNRFQYSWRIKGNIHYDKSDKFPISIFHNPHLRYFFTF